MMRWLAPLRLRLRHLLLFAAQAGSRLAGSNRLSHTDEQGFPWFGPRDDELNNCNDPNRGSQSLLKALGREFNARRSFAPQGCARTEGACCQPV